MYELGIEKGKNIFTEQSIYIYKLLRQCNRLSPQKVKDLHNRCFQEVAFTKTKQTKERKTSYLSPLPF